MSMLFYNACWPSDQDAGFLLYLKGRVSSWRNPLIEILTLATQTQDREKWNSSGHYFPWWKLRTSAKKQDSKKQTTKRSWVTLWLETKITETQLAKTLHITTYMGRNKERNWVTMGFRKESPRVYLLCDSLDEDFVCKDTVGEEKIAELIF